MPIHPILSALLRNKTGLVLIALQIALTLAIVANAVFIIGERVAQMSRPSGLDEDNLFSVSSLTFRNDRSWQDAVELDLATLRSMPGVAGAIYLVTGMPLSGGGWSEGIGPRELKDGVQDPDQTGVTIYNVDEHGIGTLGVNLVEGRNFTAEEVRHYTEREDRWPQQIIITQALARHLFPDGSAVGQLVHMGKENPLTVIGVVERLQSPWVNWERHEQSALLPMIMEWTEHRYLVRTEPGERDRVMGQVEAALLAANDGRIVRRLRSYEEIRARGYQRHRATAITLVAVIAALLGVTGLGIVGMASFWVTTRTRQIGTRRALGARKGDVLRYFHAENLLISAIGTALGALLAFALNALLMQHFDVPRLDWTYVPAGAALLVLLGQLAVLGPALRGAQVHPTVATRSV